MTIKTSDISYIQWNVIIAGAVVACAISVILAHFGNGIGLTITNNLRDFNNPKGVIFTIGIWIFITQVVSSAVGGYTAGRMRSPVENTAAHESEIRDGVHGLLVWATATLATTVAVAVGAFFAAVAAINTESQTEQSARAISNLADNASIVFGFATAAGAVVSAAAAWAMATIGGDHRDKNTDISKFITFRKTTIVTK